MKIVYFFLALTDSVTEVLNVSRLKSAIQLLNSKLLTFCVFQICCVPASQSRGSSETARAGSATRCIFPSPEFSWAAGGD